MSNDITRTYKITFKGWPSIKDIKRELENAEKVYGEWAVVHIDHNGEFEDDLAEVCFFLNGSKA